METSGNLIMDDPYIFLMVNVVGGVSTVCAEILV